MSEERVIDLEIKIAHQEVAIEELQKALYDHHVIIEKLEKSLKKITERLDGAVGNDIGPGNQKPPHY